MRRSCIETISSTGRFLISRSSFSVATLMRIVYRQALLIVKPAAEHAEPMKGRIKEACGHQWRFLQIGQTGLSMTVLAQKAGLSQAMISFIEREIRNPSLETLLKNLRCVERAF